MSIATYRTGRTNRIANGQHRTKFCSRNSPSGWMSSYTRGHMPIHRKNGKRGGSTMIYRRPVIQVLQSLDVFFERLLPRTVPPSNALDWRAKKLKDFIDQQQGAVRVVDACRELGFPMSDRQVRRVFKVSMGIGVKEYSRNKRLAYAAERLRATNAPIKAIAMETGYQNSRHFARRFKELFHLRPTEFRRIWRRRQFAV